ncbi:hypothetical protein [Janthinobacterium sp. SUN137]|uniref:hypothetical protein n=1 Tax=Janthinobacterium sp. SUN137 TaxID=3014789 RepID=UPI0027123A21|nr:hypothetical protein [Janthinobacterium sp. SUN137]MDO8040374.1 hypothetical protein [Janthinobacterium sp. SUN137]
MPIFDLVLNIYPSSHRQCSIRIEGEATGLATFEALPIGLLPRITHTLPVKNEQMAALHRRSSVMLMEWDEQWRQLGLDGVSIDGVFDSSSSKPQFFSLWSPKEGCAAHTMLAAVFDCFPFDCCSGPTGALLEIVRSYLDLQPPVSIISYKPMHLRLAPWVHANDAFEVESHLRTLADDADLIVDASGVERFCGALTRLLPVEHLLKRRGEVRWIVGSEFSNALIQAGVAQSMIEIAPVIPISRTGEPIVLGGIFAGSSDLISFAKAGERMQLVRSFRKKYALTIEQASKAAAELLEIVACHPVL